MTKYSDIEIQTAKNLLKEGYMWIVRDANGRLFACPEKPIKVDNLWGFFEYNVFVCRYVPIFQNIRFGDKEPVSLEAIVHPQVLDDAEKRYLSAVIRPFRGRVECIIKTTIGCEEHILIQLNGDLATLPRFKKGTMYKGMDADKWYSLEELGL